VRHQAEPPVPREIRAGAARLASASLREESRELRVSHRLLNDFTKSSESASTLAGNQHLNQGNRLTKVKQRIWTLEFSFLMLLRSQSIH
jgi:hypothetical protein